MIGIYVIENLVNHKVYVGQSWNIRARLTEHRRLLKQNKCANIHLQRAYNIYGESNFDFKVLVDLSYISELNETEAQTILDENERYWINFFGGHENNNTYNLKEGGYNGKFSYEVKKKFSEKRKGKFIGENNPMFGRHHTENTKNLISQNRKNKGGRHFVMSDEQKLKISMSKKGKKQADEVRLRRAETMKKVRKSPEYIKNYKEGIKKAGLKRRKYSDEFVNMLRTENKNGMSIKKLSIKYNIPFESCRIMIKGEQRFSDVK